MPELPSDDQLLDFDVDEFDDGEFDLEVAREALRSEHADLYRNQLIIAHWLQSWAQREAEREGEASDRKYFWNAAPHGCAGPSVR